MVEELERMLIVNRLSYQPIAISAALASNESTYTFFFIFLFDWQMKN
ncbi:unnamed protein product [Arabidopsis halleri]